MEPFILPKGTDEEYFVEFGEKERVTFCTILWTKNRTPYMAWMGVSHRNPVDALNEVLGRSLALYRAVNAADGEASAVVLRNRTLRSLYHKAEAYVLAEAL